MRHYLRIVAVLLLTLISSACVSTGDPEHPVRLWTAHEWLYGHEKYTPEEKVFARCRFRNRLPDGTRSGFQRACRLRAAELFPMGGINQAMYATACQIESCAAVAFGTK